MSVNFQTVLSIAPETWCAICQEEGKLKPSSWLAHDGNGIKHPFHKECIKEWIKVQAICPTCRIDINPKSVLSLNERLISSLRNNCPQEMQTLDQVIGTLRSRNARIIVPTSIVTGLIATLIISQLVVNRSPTLRKTQLLAYSLFNSFIRAYRIKYAFLID